MFVGSLCSESYKYCQMHYQVWSILTALAMLRRADFINMVYLPLSACMVFIFASSSSCHRLLCGCIGVNIDIFLLDDRLFGSQKCWHAYINFKKMTQSEGWQAAFDPFQIAQRIISPKVQSTWTHPNRKRLVEVGHEFLRSEWCCESLSYNFLLQLAKLFVRQVISPCGQR